MSEIVIAHPLDDDGFIDHAIKEFTEITNKWNLVIETDENGKLCLVYRCKVWNVEEKYNFKYNYESDRYE